MNLRNDKFFYSLINSIRIYLKKGSRLNSFLKRYGFLILLLVLIVPSFVSLIHTGYFNTHEGLPQLIRLYQMDKCFQDLQIPCRWVPSAYGYGYPLFNYYPPLPYYLGELIHLLGINFLDTVKMLAALGFIASGLAMFILAREFWGNLGGLVSAIFYVYAPYHAVDLYVRGAMNEFYALVFLPAILWASYKLIKTQQSRYIYFLALSFGGLLLSHNLIAIAFAPFLAIWLIFHLAIAKSIKPISKLTLAFIFSLGLAAFFSFPVLLEMKLTYVQRIALGDDYVSHFADLNQMFISRFWGYGTSVLGPKDSMPFQIGHLHWIVTFLSSLLALFLVKSEGSKHRLFILLLTITTLGGAFMAHYSSKSLWDKIPTLAFIQFPWRFLALVILFTSLACGALILWVSRKFRPWLGAGLIILVFILNLSYFKPYRWNYTYEKEDLSQKPFPDTSEYLPISVKVTPATFPTSDAILLEPNTNNESLYTFSSLVKKSNYQNYKILNPYPNLTQLRVSTFYFPGWAAYLNDEKTAIFYESDTHGRIHVQIPPGEHTLVLKFQNTPVRSISNLITVASLGLFLLPAKKWLFTKRKK